MRPRVLVTRRLFPEVLDRLSIEADVDAHPVDSPLNADELARRLCDKDGALITLIDRIDARALAGADRLKVVSNVAVGYNNIDLTACRARGVMATNTPDVLTETTADLAFALLLNSARRVGAAERWLRAGQWQGWKFADPWLGSEVHGATLGIVGYGRIGAAVARRAAGFGMQVLAHSRSGRTPELPGARAAGFDELLATADYMMVLAPYSAQTHHLIGAAQIARMKPTAHVINVARGGVVDDAALIAALRAGRIAGAALDVFEGEPALNPGFLDLDNVVLTPHIGSSTRATRLAMALRAADNLLAALRGERPRDLLNPEALPAA